MFLITRFCTNMGLMSDGIRTYLDNAATTEIDVQAKAAMLDCLHTCWGNPSGSYAEGRRAKGALEWARTVFSEGLDVPATDVCFTSCGTESNNIAIRSVMRKQIKIGRTVLVTTSIEHSSVRETAEMCGCKHIETPVDDQGVVLLTEFEKILTADIDRIGMISVIYAQNEVGTVQRIKDLVAVARRVSPDFRIPFHIDATQALCKIPVNVRVLDVDMLTASAHKFHGPRGVGILYSRPGLVTRETTPMTGGGQEEGKRSGTENVPAIVGAAVAFSFALAGLSGHAERLFKLKSHLETEIRRILPGVIFNSSSEKSGHALPNIVNFCMPDGVHGHDMVERLDKMGVSVNAGSACTRMKSPSKTLLAMGRSPELAHSAIRVSMSLHTTRGDCDKFLIALEKAASEEARGRGAKP